MPGFIQILHHCSASWKKVKFWNFWVVGWKFTKFLMSYLKLSHFFFKLRSWEITILYFFSWNFILFWVPNFRLSISPNLYLDRLLLLKAYKISAKKVEKSLMTLKIDAKFEKKLDLLFQNWQKFGEFLSEHSKISKMSTLNGSLNEKNVILQTSYLSWH